MKIKFYLFDVGQVSINEHIYCMVVMNINNIQITIPTTDHVHSLHFYLLQFN